MHKHTFVAVPGTEGGILRCRSCPKTKGTVNTHELTGPARRAARASARKARRG